jgi:hypothetical protein
VTSFAVGFERVSAWTSTSFPHFVIYIVLVRSEKQMLWIDAQPVVAAMQNMKPIWYLAVVSSIRKSVRALLPVFILQVRISFCVGASKPKPAATIRLWN